MRWADGSVYQGFWNNNMYNGRGKINHINGTVYEGLFKDDQAHGFGVFRLANGSI